MADKKPNKGILGIEIDQESLDKFITKGTKLVHSPESRDQVINVLNSNNPIESVADATVSMIQRLDQVSRKAGQEVDDFTKLEGANVIMGQVIELGEASGKIPKMTDQEKVTALAVSVEKYMAGEIQGGRVDPKALGDSLGQGLGQMGKKQLQQVDQDIRMINDTAVGSTKQTVQQNVQEAEQQGVLG